MFRILTPIHTAELKNIDVLCYFIPDTEFNDVDDKARYKAMLTRDERRFNSADRDRDGVATREEFTAFLHPEEFDHMRAIVIQVLGVKKAFILACFTETFLIHVEEDSYGEKNL